MHTINDLAKNWTEERRVIADGDSGSRAVKHDQGANAIPNKTKRSEREERRRTHIFSLGTKWRTAY